MADFAQQREHLLAELRKNHICDERVLAALQRVPREDFVPPEMQGSAYENAPLPIGYGQTISQPFIVADMIQLAGIGPESRVLEVGTGSGYAAAVLSLVAGEVYTIERQELLFERARRRLAALGYRNITVRLGDGSAGWPEQAPFDAILVAAAAAQPPVSLIEQLRPGGHLIIPVGQHPNTQKLVRIVRDAVTGSCKTEEFGDVSFVPLASDH